MAARIALVTGANDGIGFEIAKQLAQKGYKVFVGARSAEKGNPAVKQISEATGSKSVEFLQLEITDSASVAAAVKTVESKDGKLDILVNNAGIANLHKFAEQQPLNLDLDVVRSCMDTNFYGTIGVTLAFIPLLKKSSLPVVVFVSTDMASTTFQARPDSQLHVVAYNTSKAALNSYAVALSRTFTEAKVNVVTPGYTSTKLNGFGKTGGTPKTPADGAALIVKYAVLDKDGPTGKFFDDQGEFPW
eukprot:Phypoly_transcript_16441.p1 GENE.Phypoly_transcript_16441~~Phypoly_transcript_16441.p1  ORF type:complete len:246 (+),score=52.93 Phypoly_transcript_16441:95-832(+)